MVTIPSNIGGGPDEPPPEQATIGERFIPRHRRFEDVSLDELLAAAAESAPQPTPATGLVFQPPCRAHPRPAWQLVDRLVFGQWGHTWRAMLLLVVLTGAVCGVLLAGSVALKATVLSVVGLGMLSRLGHLRLGPVPLK